MTADPIAAAWEMARASGSYQYRTLVEQTTYPQPTIRNAGSQPKLQIVGVEGSADLPNEMLTMTFWQNAGFDPNTGIGVRVTNGKTEARRGQDEWVEVDDVTQMFAPGGDPLGFLAGVENVTVGESRAIDLGGTTIESTQYLFDIDGPAFAAHMRTAMERQLREQGRLPAGMRLSTSEAYKAMTGHGELWIGANGLPQRLVLDIDVPAHGEQERVTANISNDYFGYDMARLGQMTTPFAQAPHIWLAAHMPTQQIGIGLLVITLLGGLGYLMLAYGHTSRFYRIVAGLMVSSMLLTPLLQAREARAFSDTQSAEKARREQQLAEQEQFETVQAEKNNTDWQPNVPATTQLQTDLLSTSDPFTSHKSHLTVFNSVGPDTDGDGITDDDEINLWGTDPNDDDSDDDGLLDGVEAYEIGTAPGLPDTDSDQISDALEIQGFNYNGQQWYTDPLDADSNRDGLSDGTECAIWFEGNPDYDPMAICPDTDSDGTPDLFDTDNDGDGVIDKFDVSPMASGTQVYDFDNQLEVTLNNLEIDRPVYLDLQLRPTDPGHLDYVQSVYDWPTGDHEGQVTRYLDTTWADTSNPALQSSAANAANGDIRIIPVIELLIPAQAGHFGNLPVNDTYSGGSRPPGSVEEWIDQSRLDPYGVTVSDAGDPALAYRDILAYVPVSVIDNPDTGESVALGMRMPYFPEQGSGGIVDWGAAHSFNLVWLVQMLTDDCTDPDDLSTCEEVVRVIHGYDDEWMLTGMHVSEEQGMDVAIVYENPATDPDLTLDDQLWATSWGLNATFARGRDVDQDGVRDVRIDNLAVSIDEWHDPASGPLYIEVETVGGFDHADQIMTVMMTDTIALLDSAFAGYETQTVPSFLFVKEVTNRDLSMEGMSVVGNAISADFDGLTPVTTAALTWKPYEYNGGAWVNADPQSYLETLEYQLSQNVFIAEEDDDPDYIDEIEGRLVWAQMYYSALYQGISNIVAADETAVVPPAEYAVPETVYESQWPTATFSGAAYVGTAFFFATIAGLGTTIRNVTPGLSNTEGTFYSSFKSSLGESRNKNFANNFAGSDSGAVFRFGIDVLLIMVAIIAIFATLAIIYGLIIGDKQIVQTALIVLNVTTIIVSLVHLAVIVNALYTLYQVVTGAIMASLQMLSRITTFLKNSNAVGAAGLVIGLLVTWGIFLYQLLGPGFDGSKIAKNIALSLAIASSAIILVQAILYILIAFVVSAAAAGVLSILFLLFIIVEAILFLAGEKTITERATQAIAELLYDVDFVLANFNSPDRLAFDITSISLNDPDLGMVVDNGFRATIAITNTINYRKEFNDAEGKYAAFAYYAQTSRMDQHSTLSGNSIREQWVELPGRTLQYTDTVTSTVYEFATVGTGLNRPIENLYLTEAYALPYKGCWLGITGCNREYIFDSLHINIGEELLFDVFPNSLDEFVDFDTWTAGITDTVAFEVQQDSDNDGLIVGELGGSDPDDSDSDVDGDTVSDYVELTIGTDPNDPDSDDDGLTDGEELAYLTDPLDKDTDDDGLTDTIEVKTGWLVPYGVNSDTMRVWSNPFRIDADGDRLSDFQEYLFSLHPGVPNDPAAITNIVQIDDMRVEEPNAPELHLAFEENSTATVFKDGSGNGHVAVCAPDNTACPTAGDFGRYEYATFFDNDGLQMDASRFDFADDFSIGMWLKTPKLNMEIISLHDDLTGLDNPGEFLLGLDSDGKPYIGQRLVSETFGYINGATVINDDTWHHLVFVWERESATGKVYVDGIDDTNGVTTYEAIDRDPTIDTLNIGDNVFNRFYKGALDDVVFYDHALAANEIDSVLNGRFNNNDLIVRPGDELRYQAAVTNTLFTQALDGYLIGATEYISPAVAAPDVILPFDADDRIITFPNDVTGEDSGIGCRGDGSDCPTFDIAGVYGNAVEFDAPNEQLSLPSVHQGLSTGSIAFWIRPNSFPAAGSVSTILDTDSDEIGALDITLDSDGHLNFDIFSRDFVAAHRTNDPLPLNTWTHVLWLRFYNDTTTNNSYSTIIIDGGLPNSENHNFPVAPPTLSIGPGRLGNSMAGDAPFDGAIDELVFYNDQILWSIGDVNRAEEVRNGNYYPGLDTEFYVTWPAYLLQFETGQQGSFRNAATDAQSAACTSAATCPTIAMGKYEDSADFDGTNDQLTMPNVVNPGEDAFTAMAWINLDSYSATGMVFLAQQTGTGVGRQWLGISDSGELFTRVGGTYISSTESLAIGSWHHAALTSDGTTIKLYLDGVLVNQVIDPPLSNDGGMVVGNHSAGNIHFDGQIDDLMIISDVLDADSIRVLMDHRYPAIDIDDPLVDFHIDASTAVETNYLNALARHDESQFVTGSMTIPSGDVCTTCPTVLRQSGAGLSLQFDGVDDWLDVGTSPYLDDQYTFGFWMKTDHIGTENQTIVALTDDNGAFLPGALVEVKTDGHIRYLDRANVGSSGGTSLFSTNSIADGKWHHVVVTRVYINFGFPDSEYEMQLYIDGVLDDMATVFGDIDEEPLRLSIGRYRPATPRYYTGEIDEMIVHSFSVSSSDVLLLMERTAPDGDQGVVSGSAEVSALAGIGLHRFEETVEAALQPLTPVDYPIVDDNAGALQLFVPFEDVPASERFQNMIDTGDMLCEMPACPAAGVRGIADRAALFDGRDDRIGGATFSADDVTLAAWVNAKSGTVIDMRDIVEGSVLPPEVPPEESGTGMWLDMNGVHLLMKDAATGDAKTRYDLPLTLPLGQWVHIAAVFDTSTGVVTAYVDGVQVASEMTALLANAGNAWTGDNPVLGATKFGSSVLDGYLDDVRIYNVALSSAEITALIASSTPKLRFEFDEEADAPVFVDSSLSAAIGVPTTNAYFDATLGMTVTVRSPIAGTDGQIGNTALFLNDGAITLDDASHIDTIANDMTIMAWINPDELVGIQNIIGHARTSSNDGFMFNVNADGNLRFTLGGVKQLVSAATVQTETWQHVAVVFDSGNDAYFYLNGALIDTVSNASSMLLNSDDPLMIGGTTEIGTGNLRWLFDGQIDELALYSREMSAAELESIYLRDVRWYRARSDDEIVIDSEVPTLSLVTDHPYRLAGYTQLVVAANDVTSWVTLLDMGIRPAGTSEFAWHGSAECEDSERAGVAWCPVLDLTDGAYELQFRAVDAVGHETTSSIYPLYVDGQAPTGSSSYSDSWLSAQHLDELTWQVTLSGSLQEPQIGSVAGSGIVTDSVMIALHSATGDILDGGSQRAAVDGAAWSVDYRSGGALPQGVYTVTLSVQDAVGNSNTFDVGTIVLDERASSADVNRWQLPVTTIISDTLVLTGTVSEAADWGNELGVYHFEQVTEPFYDSGFDLAHATCTNCPSSTAGVYGQALQFDGVDDTVHIPNPFNPLTDTFSVAVWFMVDSSQTGSGTLVQQDNGTGQGRTLLFVDNNDKLRSNLGLAGSVGTATIIRNEWHHAALTWDGEVVRIYLDGLLDGEMLAVAESADGELQLGSNRGGSMFLNGMIDDVTIYGHPLSAQEVSALAKLTAWGVGGVRVGYQTVDFSALLTETVAVRAGTIVTTTWIDATVDTPNAPFSMWSLTDNTPLEDFYTVLLESSDADGNVSSNGTVWRGMIDRIAPRVIFTGTHIISGTTALTEFTFTFEDFALDNTTFVHPCASEDLVITTYDKPDEPLDGLPHQVSATCHVDGHVNGDVTVTTCDLAGLCTTETVTFTPTAVVMRSVSAESNPLFTIQLTLFLMLFVVGFYLMRKPELIQKKRR
ncbi:MAG: hypothetical protein M9918_17410 [Anaerolineae bacterium]|nr:hypothetical protein [Anaerolineae bacterium]